MTRRRSDPRPDRAPAHPTKVRALRLERGWTIAQAAAWAREQGLRCSLGTWRTWESADTGREPPAILLRLLRGELS